MSKSRDFCLRCDDPAPEQPELLPGMSYERDDMLCDSCYFEDSDLVDAPDEMQARIYTWCGATHRGNRRVDVGVRNYTDTAIEEVLNSLGVCLNAEEVRWGVEPEQVDENNVRTHCHFSSVVRDTSLEGSIVVPASVVHEMCQHYSRIAGGYPASLAQVRAGDRTPTIEETKTAVEIAEPYIAEREGKSGRSAFITEVNRMPDDPNIRISTNQMGSGVAKRIRERFGGTIEEHPTLVMEGGDGNEVYRVVFVVRLPWYTADDVIDPEDGDGLVLVRSNRGRLKGTRFTSGDLYESEFEEGRRPEAEDFGSIEGAAGTTVVTVEDERAIQVLDPKMYEAKTTPRPDHLDPDASIVPVLGSSLGLHIFSEEVIDDDEE